MRRSRFVVLLVGSCRACTNLKAVAGTHHEARVAEINRTHAADAEDARARWGALLAQVDGYIAEAERSQIAVIPGTGDRRRRAILAAAFSAFGNSTQQASARSSTRPASVTTASAVPECFNDYQCGIGNVCA